MTIPLTLTYEEFLERYEGVHAEWKDGEVIRMPPASWPHQDLIRFLVALLSAHVEAQGSGVVVMAPFQTRLGPDLPGREPDLMFIANERRGQLHRTWLEGPADLAVEVVSPDSRLRDRGEKRAEYEAAGVREYWILDPDRRTADFLVLGPDGRYRAAEPTAGRYRSTVLEGFELPVEWLWREPLPGLVEALRELGLA